MCPSTEEVKSVFVNFGQAWHHLWHHGRGQQWNT
ncbi:hypothetical protein E2C01_030925 [Portunus trituberculatus]|uniref:Uncharacterized protein n=1 Tax=Portunus trituberculatus TaxID=210409 RepID=A0A5B7EVH5_PORTR|nr:hypothetical protein [Portunus trituberculatus]